MRWMWEELGIAPTDDAVAIKRAYAKRLKTTRPDDDAAAYQQLREAYDAALGWARVQRERASASAEDVPPVVVLDEAAVPVAMQAGPSAEAFAEDGISWSASDDGFSAAPPDASPAPPDATAPEDSDDAPTEFASPEAIARGVYGYWREHGDEALVALWPRVRYDLDALPLTMRADASNWMATLVLDCEELPAGFVLPLAAYFGWREDFRAAAALGGERAHALHERLHALGLRGKPDDALLRRFHDVRASAELLRQRKVWRARLLAVLMPGGAADAWRQAPEDLRKTIGIPRDEGTWVNALMSWHWGARIAGWITLFMLLIFAMGDAPARAYTRAGIAVWIACFVLTGSWLYTFLIDGMAERLPEALKYWRDHHPRLTTLMALTVSGALAVWAAFMPADKDASSALQFLGGWGVALLLPLIDWPEQRHWRVLLPPVSIALTFVLRGLWPEHSVLLAFALAQAWTLAASALLRYRTGEVVALYRNPFAYLRPRNAWGWIVFVVFIKGVAFLAVALCVVALPLSIFVSTLRHGMVAGFATLACAGVIAKGITDGDDLPLALLIGLVAAVWLMAALRWLSGKLADRLHP